MLLSRLLTEVRAFLGKDEQNNDDEDSGSGIGDVSESIGICWLW